MNNYLDNLKSKTDVRRTLIAMKEAIRDDAAKEALAEELAGDFSVFREFLDDADAKTRKNAARIIGELAQPQMRECLWEAYQREKTLFVRPDYLKALQNYDCTPYLEQMKTRAEELKARETAPEEEKHIYAELTALKETLMKSEHPKKHKFKRYDDRLEVILLTNRNNREVTARQIPEEKIRLLASGLRFETTHLEEILPLRTYSELLFPIPGSILLEGSPEHMAQLLMHSQIMSFLREHHSGGGAFYFRLEVKSSMPQERKVDLVKKLSAAIEKASDRALLNAPGGYEMELRLIANKEGRFLPLLKLFTIHDWRFAYRKEVLPTSISPVNAATIMETAKEYLTNNAQVLDPFCGVGTMLVERGRAGKTGTMYGLDILGEAVVKARENTRLARLQHVNYINRDFFDFRHAYLFDEIVTNLPAAGKTRGDDEVTGLYHRFLERIPQFVKPGAVIIAYSAAPSVLRGSLRRFPEYRVQREITLLDKDEGSAFVFCLNKK